jgi:hypothetical protein
MPARSRSCHQIELADTVGMHVLDGNDEIAPGENTSNGICGDMAGESHRANTGFARCGHWIVRYGPGFHSHGQRMWAS